jgi:hypothetical protein
MRTEDQEARVTQAIARGPITEAYHADPQQVVRELNRLRATEITQAVDWLELHGYAHVDRALGGSPSYHFFVAVAPTINSACNPRGDAAR